MAVNISAADPEVLRRGGIDLAGVSRILEELEDELEPASYAKYYTMHGEDHFTKALDASYLPAAMTCLEFVRLLKDLIVHHGQSVVDSGEILGNADETATDVAVGRRA